MSGNLIKKKTLKNGFFVLEEIKTESFEETVEVDVPCSDCNINKKVRIPAKMFKKNDLITVSIKPNIVCEHALRIYIDKHFNVRDCSSADYYIG